MAPSSFDDVSATTGSRVPQESLDHAHANCMPDAAQPVGRRPSGLIPGQWPPPGSDAILVRTCPQWFTRVRLHGPHLTRSRRAFSHDAHHHRSRPQQLGAVWSLHVPAGSEAPALISRTARLLPVGRYLAASFPRCCCARASENRSRTWVRLAGGPMPAFMENPSRRVLRHHNRFRPVMPPPSA